MKGSWYRMDETRQSPVSLQRRLQIVSEIPRAKTALQSFNPTNDDCLTDLKKLGINAGNIRTAAGDDYKKGGTTFVDVRGVPANISSQLRPGAAFTSVTSARLVIFNMANFWQSTYSQVEGTLLHELVHMIQPNFEDTDIQKRLGITKDGIDTSNISKKLCGRLLLRRQSSDEE